MDNSLTKRVSDLLDKHQKLAIVVGRNPNMDNMGAALALYLTLRDSGKNVTIASPSDPLVEISSLVGIDQVKKELSGEGGDLVVSFPYKDGEIDKVSYTLEQGYLNIIVKAGEAGLSFQDTDVQFKRAGGVPDLLFVVGTPNLSDLGSLFDPEGLKNTAIVNIDNKTQNQGFGDVVMVDPAASSVSEVVGNLISGLGLAMDTDIAQNLMSGIAFGTDNFQNPNTTPYAFEMAGILMKKGATRKAAPVQAPTAPFFPQQPQQQRPFQQQQRGGQNRPQQQHQQRQQPQQQSSHQQQQAPYQARNSMRPEEKEQQAPPDWLTPKVYKGSSNV